MADPKIVYSPVYKQNILTNHDWLYKNSIELNKLWEPHSCDKICYLIENDTDFIDIGANIGLITLGTRLMNQTINNNKINTIHCFECHPEIFRYLSFNVIDHDNIKLYNFALGDEYKLCNLCFNIHNNGNTMIETTYENGLPVDNPRGYPEPDPISTKSENNVYIHIVPLDSLIDNFSRRVSVIKIDVEGFEYNVLLGACKFIEKHKPVIFIEISSSKYQQTHELLEKYNYIQMARLTDEDYIYQSFSKVSAKQEPNSLL
jgi:FkbM family methyltransferase